MNNVMQVEEGRKAARDAGAVLAEISAAGVSLRVDDAGKLKASPPDAVTAQVQSLVAEHRTGLLALLRSRQGVPEFSGMVRKEWWLVGATVFMADDDAPVMPVHAGVPVYFAFERELMRGWSKSAVQDHHYVRTALMSIWPGWGQVPSWDVKDKQGNVTTAGLAALCKRARVRVGDAQAMLGVLYDAGVIGMQLLSSSPRGDTWYWLIGPSERAQARKRRRAGPQIISREIIEPHGKVEAYDYGAD